MKEVMTMLHNEARPNNRINSDWQLRYAPLPAGYAERYAVVQN